MCFLNMHPIPDRLLYAGGTGGSLRYGACPETGTRQQTLTPWMAYGREVTKALP